MAEDKLGSTAEVTRDPVDPHAEQREQKRRERRYGMQVSGRSVQVLAKLSVDPTKKKAPARKKRRR